MKHNLRHIIVPFLIISVLLFLFLSKKISTTVAFDNYYEPLKISVTSLNGNSIWGKSESYDDVVLAGGLDNSAAFYSTSHKTIGGLDSSGSISVNNIPYKFHWSGNEPYDGNDTIRLYSDKTSSKMELETIGAYEQIYILGTAGGIGEENYAKLSVSLNYTDGTTDAFDYRLYDWHNATTVSGIYKYPSLAKRLIEDNLDNHDSDYNYEGTTTGAPYLQSGAINANPKKLLKSIDFKLLGQNNSDDTSDIFCGIYAITGMVNLLAPKPVENIFVDKISDSKTSITWDRVMGATSYRLDISTDVNFLNILPDYDNLSINDTQLIVKGLNPETRYYTRIRAENVNGQSISPNPISFTTLSHNSERDSLTPTGEIANEDLTEDEPDTTEPENTTDETIDHEKIEAFEYLIINELSTANNYSSEYSDAIDEAINLYSNLSNEEKENVNPEVIERYNEIVDLYYHSEPELTIISDDNDWKTSDIIEISTTDISGVEGIYLRKNIDDAWEKITEFNSIAYEVKQNGTLFFKAVDIFGNETIKSVVHTKIDSARPKVALDSHGYELGTWTNSNVIISASNETNNISPVTVYVSNDNNNWEVYQDSIIVTNDTNIEGITYYFKAISDTGLESEIIEGNIKKDSVSPTGTIQLDDNSWNKFLNTITFGLFFNETKEFHITPVDELSGIEKIEYAFNEDYANNNWSPTDGTISVNPERDFAIYVKITDKANNTRVINTDGIVLDTTSATIIGYAKDKTYELKEGKTYYLTQKISVNDNKALDSLYINNTKVEIPENCILELSGDIGAENHLILKDKAGNLTELTIKNEDILNNELETENINTDNTELFKTEIERLNDFINNPNIELTTDERQIISDVINEYSDSVEAIEELSEILSNIQESYEMLPGINHINSNHKEQILGLIRIIDSTIEQHDSQLTEEERNTLNNIVENLIEYYSLLNQINNKIANIRQRTNSFKLETVTSDDKSALEEIKALINELKESSNLTNEERIILNNCEAEINALLERIEEVENKLKELEEETKPIQGINKDNVLPEDQTSLEEAQSSYVEALGVFDGNLSLSELFDINNAISIINSALDVLDQVAEFEAIVSKLPEPGDVNYSYRFAIKIAQAAYSELSDYAKTLVGPSLLNKYKAVLTAYQALLDGSPLLTAIETLDVFWWGLSTFFIAGAFIIIVRRTHKRYSYIDNDDF